MNPEAESWDQHSRTSSSSTESAIIWKQKSDKAFIAFTFQLKRVTSETSHSNSCKIC